MIKHDSAPCTATSALGKTATWILFPVGGRKAAIRHAAGESQQRSGLPFKRRGEKVAKGTVLTSPARSCCAYVHVLG